MRKDLNLEQMEREENAYTGLRPPVSEAHSPQARKEVEQIVVMIRLELYNRGLPCGPKVLRRRLDAQGALKPLPSKANHRTYFGSQRIDLRTKWLV
ncbi:MAG: hypothetical protein ABIK20_00375 [Candidatus Omnitrophota bacterium]